MNVTPLINGQSYSHGMIVCSILGRPVIGVKSIEYSQKQEKKDGYYAGNLPADRGYGIKEAEGKITLAMKEVEAIMSRLPKGQGLVDIGPFDITVSWVSGNNTLIQHKLKNCEFKGNMVKSASGDTHLDRDLDLIVSHIEGL